MCIRDRCYDDVVAAFKSLTSKRIEFQTKDAFSFGALLNSADREPGEGIIYFTGNTVQLQDWDGRYSRRNKEWAKTIPNDNPETVRCGYALNSHPAVLDGFIDLVREEQQRSRTQREKLQPSRPSVRDKLKQELPAHKPASPKKREPER